MRCGPIPTRRRPARRSRHSKRHPNCHWPRARSTVFASRVPKRNDRGGIASCDGVDLGELAELAEVCERFGRLTAALGDDPEAWFNYGLCLAWTGQHRPAIACLEQVVSLEADANFNHAVEAWVLAEVLRQGGGAESLCDDLRYACTFPWKPGDTADLEAAFAEIRRIPTPRDPTRFEGDDAELEILEWLDRPMPAADSVRTEADLPRVLATTYITPGSLRLSSPRVDTLEEAEEKLRRLLGARAENGPARGGPASPALPGRRNLDRAGSRRR